MTQYRPTRRQFIGATNAAALATSAGCTTSGFEGTTQPTDDDPEPTDDPPETDTQTQATTTDSADAVTVEMHTDNRGVYFDPKGLHVEPGTTVRFLNLTGSHSSTPYHPQIDDSPRCIPPDDLPPSARDGFPPIETIVANGTVPGP